MKKSISKSVNGFNRILKISKSWRARSRCFSNIYTILPSHILKALVVISEPILSANSPASIGVCGMGPAEPVGCFRLVSSIQLNFLIFRGSLPLSLSLPSLPHSVVRCGSCLQPWIAHWLCYKIVVYHPITSGICFQSYSICNWWGSTL